MFRYRSGFLINERGKVMDVHGNRDVENRDIIVWNKHGGLNQQWDLIYSNQWPKEPKKGQLNKDFGIVVERDFYIVSNMRSRRYLDIINNRNIVIKTRNGRKTQRWYFHQQSLTIKTRYNNQSWDIKSAGKTSTLQIWSTNSGWW
jgi:membrane carboxypeptidase/penicillin-binding protein PbpC